MVGMGPVKGRTVGNSCMLLVMHHEPWTVIYCINKTVGKFYICIQFLNMGGKKCGHLPLNSITPWRSITKSKLRETFEKK